MTTVYIGLGSNMESPKQHITTAIDALGEIQSTRVTNVSSIYKSKPVGPQDQDDYVNAVVELETELTAIALLDNLQAIENEHGRVRTERWGPRTLDLDILMFADDVIQNERLTVPHIEMTNRCFVLVPLAELKPDIQIPGKGSINDVLKNIDQDSLEILA